ncbi:MBL fold metallo-hydrolase [Aquimarina sp. Aq78]|uniref:MBL fold metallo-hydrolase n=1 Tax=Aquimarina sp. Aq78 TaxID=1191889 RepID=UPI0018FEDEA8|nr:MBL fold metallo-hydrolase [Aquimarina sp. Aq78]
MNPYKKISIILAFVVGTVNFTVSAQQAKVLNLDKNVHAISLMGYTSLVVEGDNEVLITDTANPVRANILKKEIEKLTDKPVGKIVLTHEHFDHTGGTEVFKDAEIIAQKNVKNLDGLDPLDLFPDTIDILFEKHLTINLGTTVVELKYLGAADGAAIAVVHLPKERIVVTSDMYTDEGINEGIFLSHTNLLGTRYLLKTILSWNLNHSINTHSSRTDITHLKETVAFLDDLYEAIISRLKKMDKNNGHELLNEVFRLKKSLKLPKYKDWKNYKDLPVYIQKMGYDIIHGG